MSPRQSDIVLGGLNFQIDYTPGTDTMEYTTIRKAHFELYLTDDEEGENIIKDKVKANEWLQIGLEGKLLLDHLTNDDYKPIFKALKLNPLNVDVAFFQFEWRFFSNNDDQRIELESTKALTNTVNGRKYMEKINGA